MDLVARMLCQLKIPHGYGLVKFRHRRWERGHCEQKTNVYCCNEQQSPMQSRVLCWPPPLRMPGQTRIAAISRFGHESEVNLLEFFRAGFNSVPLTNSKPSSQYWPVREWRARESKTVDAIAAAEIAISPATVHHQLALQIVTKLLPHTISPHAIKM